MGGGEIGRRSPEWRCRVRVYVMLVSSVWCLLAPSRGGVPPLGDTQSAEPTLGDPSCGERVWRERPYTHVLV